MRFALLIMQNKPVPMPKGARRLRGGDICDVILIFKGVLFGAPFFRNGGFLVKVYALVGESGSGKSYRAMWIAGKYKLDFVIDDGLLISGGKVVAGKSAKREKTRMGSVKRAIFFYDEDAEAMRRALQKNKVESLLILGTSTRMADKIADRIGASPVQKYIDISEIATEEEIETAHRIRNTQGMHVIPVPTMAIKKDFQGYFMDTLEILLSKSKYKDEKTVMRPSYSYMGDYIVQRSVLEDICRHEANGVAFVKAQEVRINSLPGGITVNIGIVVCGIHNIRRLCQKIRFSVSRALEEYAGMVVDKIDISVKDIEL